MKVMHCIKLSDAHKHNALSKQPLLSLIDGSSRQSLPHRLWIIDVRRVTTGILQETGEHILTICDVLLDTPPSRYIYT